MLLFPIADVDLTTTSFTDSTITDVTDTSATSGKCPFKNFEEKYLYFHKTIFILSL